MTDEQALRGITRRLIAHVDAKTTQQVAEIHRIPASAYRDRDRWSREVDEVSGASRWRWR